MSALIEFQKVSKVYKMGDSTVVAANEISMQINRGEFVAIVGSSGSGKSTCMNIIGCLDVPTSGTYLLDGRDVGRMNKNELAEIRNEMLGFIFQQYNLLPKLNILENVEVPLMYRGVPRGKRRELAKEALEKVVLADEPTGALDSRTGREVLGMLQDLHDQGRTVVLITHDNSIAVEAERIIRLEDGCVVYDGPSDAPEAVVTAARRGKSGGAES